MIILKSRQNKIKYSQLSDTRNIAKHYGMSIKQAENEVRAHLDGANAQERREVYQDAFRKREK